MADAFSGQFLRAIPFDGMLFNNAAWAVSVATYAGVPIPQAAPFVGVPLKCKRRGTNFIHFVRMSEVAEAAQVLAKPFTDFTEI